MYDFASTFLESELDYRTERIASPRTSRVRRRRKHFQPLYTRRSNIDA